MTHALLPLLLLAAATDQTSPPTPPTEAVDWDKEFGVERQEIDPTTGEIPVGPYTRSNANAGARPHDNSALVEAFGGQAGIRRITDRLVAISLDDPRIADIFKAKDHVRLRRTLFEQVCFVLGAGCDYSGKTMADAHRDLGLRRADLNALVENLQQAMRDNRLPFAAQNRLLAKLAPMDRDIVTR